MAVLIILSGKHQGKRLTIPEGETLIGRDATCQIRLATNEVSRQHCRLICKGDQITLQDLGSRNGTLVNDVAIHGEVQLSPNDTFRVGPVAFQVSGKKSTAGPPRKAGASDDSILNWLTDESDDDTEDTTIVKRDPATSKAATPLSDSSDSLTPLPPQKKFKTIGEEGEDIIQRHYELVQSGKLPKRIPALKTETPK
jgi:pSer/pThr/pTyr-binding forkhead associated (FHA) protein